MEKEVILKPTLIKELGKKTRTENCTQNRTYGLYTCPYCKTEFEAFSNDINSGNTKSCGCYKKRRASETHKTHGLSNTRIHKIWVTLKNRVLNPKYEYFHDYGGRGITICDEWKNDFMPFYNWALVNGYSEELTIDRIDNDGNYEPTNCRWVTKTIQSRNQRIRKDNTSGYKGVHFRKDTNNFISVITVNKKRINLGRFKTAEEGAIAYNNYIIENNLEGFILNEIPQQILIEKEITDE